LPILDTRVCPGLGRVLSLTTSARFGCLGEPFILLSRFDKLLRYLEIIATGDDVCLVRNDSYFVLLMVVVILIVLPDDYLIVRIAGKRIDGVFLHPIFVSVWTQIYFSLQ